MGQSASAPTTTDTLPTYEIGSFVGRMWSAVFRQGAYCLRCPSTPTLEGKRVLITGGNNGIGLGTCRGLLHRSAHVVMLSRNAERAAEAIAMLMEEAEVNAGGGSIRHIPVDLGDLDSIVECFTHAELQEQFDVVICNAGVWPSEHRLTKQNHEQAFGVNVLGHHLLVRLMQKRSLFRDSSTLIWLTGDIYCKAVDCTTDFTFEDASGGEMAYARSKLGIMWIGREFHRRYPEQKMHIVHPGVVDTDLVTMGAIGASIKRALLIDINDGAQATLFCATQPGLENGTYIHNTLGKVILPETDHAMDHERAAAMWDVCEQLCGTHLDGASAGHKEVCSASV